MTKFPSIWGDLNVNTVTPAATEKPAEVETAPVEKPEAKVEEKVEETVVKPTETPKVEPVETVIDKKEEETPVVFSDDDVAKAYTILDEQGVLDLNDDDEFTMSPEGLADAVGATVRNKLAKEIASIPPVVQDFYAHIMEGNDHASFKPKQGEVDWSTLDISNEANQELALREFYKNQGMSQEDINEEIDDHKAAGKLDKKAEIASTALIKKQADEEVLKEAARAKAIADAEKARTDEIESIKKTIDTSKDIAGFELDDVKRANFKKYLFDINPRTGKSQMQENMANEDRRMQIAFLDFVNYTKADLTKEISTTLTKERNKKLARYTDKNVANKNSGQSVTTKVSKTQGSIVFPSIFGTQTIETED